MRSTAQGRHTREVLEVCATCMPVMSSPMQLPDTTCRKCALLFCPSPAANWPTMCRRPCSHAHPWHAQSVCPLYPMPGAMPHAPCRKHMPHMGCGQRTLRHRHRPRGASFLRNCSASGSTMQPMRCGGTCGPFRPFPSLTHAQGHSAFVLTFRCGVCAECAPWTMLRGHVQKQQQLRQLRQQQWYHAVATGTCTARMAALLAASQRDLTPQQLLQVAAR